MEDFIVVVICVAIMAVIAFTVFMARIHVKIANRNKEVEWRNLIYKVLVQNLNDVYIIIDGQTKEQVYTSPNVENVMGLCAAKGESEISNIRKLSENEMDIPDVDDICKLGKDECVKRNCRIHNIKLGKTSIFKLKVFRTYANDSLFIIYAFSDRTREEQTQLRTKEALDMAEAANASKSSFLANMSHDIRTPMNAIVGITTLIEHEADNPDKVREYTRKIEYSSRHLLNLIDEVLDMSKIESGKTILNIADFDVVEIIEQIENSFRPQTDAKRQSFIINTFNMENEWLVGDSVRLLQVLNNIISNAVKYTPTGGKIWFDIEQKQANLPNYSKLCFKVTDNGMGMSPEFIEHLFESFAREESSVTNKIQGTGLGMAITKNLVELMGGTIDVKSQKGHGSCFEIIMEFKISGSEHEKIEGIDPKEDAKLEDVLKDKKFLCAEDNELNADILKELLLMNGATCNICENGKKVVEEFEKSVPGEYDMILMDIQMPVMNGYEATKIIRKSTHPKAKSIPIIAMTANAFSEDIQKSINCGMNSHISKPVDMKLLKKTVKRYEGENALWMKD